MERKMTETLLRWKKDPNKVGLVIKGARQVGKTYIVDDFGHNNYEHYLKLDMKTDDASLFGKISAKDLIRNITSKYPEFRAEKDKSLLFIDEIQDCPDAIQSIKPLVIDGRLHVIGSGSLLGIDCKPPDSYPVGYIHETMMHQLDFEEYLWAMGLSKEITSEIRESIAEKRPFQPEFLKIISAYHRQYLVYGGMPKPVSLSISSDDMGPVIDAIDDIISGFRKDVNAYAGKRGYDINRIFDLIPTELGRVNKRFRFKDIEFRGNIGIREYRQPVDWLEGSWYVNPCRRLKAIERPLGENADESLFKMYALDTGLLVQMYGGETRRAMMDGDLRINEGAIAENAVNTALNMCGIASYYYEINKKVEIDFIAELGPDICAIEVRSGRKRRARSLKKLMEMPQGKSVGRWIKFEPGNISITEDGVEHYPLFAASFADSMFERKGLPPIMKNDNRLYRNGIR